MKLEQKRTFSESSSPPLLFPLPQAALLLLLLRDFCWQDEHILSLGGEGDRFIQHYRMRDFAVTRLLNAERPSGTPTAVNAAALKATSSNALPTLIAGMLLSLTGLAMLIVLLWRKSPGSVKMATLHCKQQPHDWITPERVA